jgi:hypothetical protein
MALRTIHITFRTCQGILLAILLATLPACEKLVDFPVDDTGRIYIRAMVGDPDNSRIYVSVSQPVEGSEQENIKASKVQIEIEADGRPLEVKHVDGTLTEAIYSVKGDLTSGRKLTLRTSVEGLPSVSAQTVIPEEIPQVRISKSSDKLKCTFSISVSEEARENSFFGVQIMKRKLYEFTGNIPDSEKNYYESKPVSEDLAGFYQTSYNMELGDLSSIKDEMVAEFAGQKMFITSGSAEGEETVLEIPIKKLSDGLVQGSQGPKPEDNYAIYEYHEYKVFLYRLSPEIYNHLKARKFAENSPLDPCLGFTPVTYTYSNVCDGLGFFGGVKAYVSQWNKFE